METRFSVSVAARAIVALTRCCAATAGRLDSSCSRHDAPGMQPTDGPLRLRSPCSRLAFPPRCTHMCAHVCCGGVERCPRVDHHLCAGPLTLCCPRASSGSVRGAHTYAGRRIVWTLCSGTDERSAQPAGSFCSTLVPSGSTLARYPVSEHR